MPIPPTEAPTAIAIPLAVLSFNEEELNEKEEGDGDGDANGDAGAGDGSNAFAGIEHQIHSLFIPCKNIHVQSQKETGC